MEYLISYIGSIDPSIRTLPDEVYTIWQAVLWIVVLVIVPLVVFQLQRTLNAAMFIRRYLRDMLAAGAGIAENTRSITKLNDTIGVAGSMVKTADNLKEHSGALATVLAQRARGGKS